MLKSLLDVPIVELSNTLGDALRLDFDKVRQWSTSKKKDQGERAVARQMCRVVTEVCKILNMASVHGTPDPISQQPAETPLMAHSPASAVNIVDPALSTLAVWEDKSTPTPVDSQTAQAWALHTWNSSCRALWKKLELVAPLIAWLPWLLTITFGVVVVSLILAVLIHPEFIVIGLARMVKFLPTYLEYVARRVADRIGYEAHIMIVGEDPNVNLIQPDTVLPPYGPPLGGLAICYGLVQWLLQA